MLAVVMVVPMAWPVFAFNNGLRQRVPLKSGLNLGYAAVFDLGGLLPEPIVVPKLPDGTPLTRDDLWNFEATDTSVLGVSYANKSSFGRAFAWRAET